MQTRIYKSSRSSYSSASDLDQMKVMTYLHVVGNLFVKYSIPFIFFLLIKPNIVLLQILNLLIWTFIMTDPKVLSNLCQKFMNFQQFSITKIRSGHCKERWLNRQTNKSTYIHSYKPPKLCLQGFNSCWITYQYSNYTIIFQDILQYPSHCLPVHVGECLHYIMFIPVL